MMSRCSHIGGGQQPSTRDYTFLAEVSFGQAGKCVVAAAWKHWHWVIVQQHGPMQSQVDFIVFMADRHCRFL